MSGKEYLSCVKKIDTQLKNKSFELKRLKELGLAAGKTLDEITKLEAEREKVIKTIERLKEEDYDVLHMIYVQYKTFQEVAADRGISRRKVDSIHGRALAHVETIINEKK